MSILEIMFGRALDDLHNIADKQAEDRERIRKEWEQSKQLPRKKKKALRKRLLVEWAIATWEPFERMW